MDSKKRHELETNDLREFLDNFKDFWDKNGNSILIALIIVVGGFAGLKWYKNTQTAKANNAAHALETAEDGAHLLKIAQDHPSIRHIALLRAGDAFLEEGRAARTTGEGDADEALKNAANAYRSVIDDDDYPTEFRINACLGSGTVAEEQGEWDKAKAAYAQAAELAGEQFEQLATLARVGGERLDGLKHPVPFGQEEPVVPAGATDLPGLVDPNDTDGDGVPDRIQLPDDVPTPGVGGDPLFPDNDPILPGFGDEPSDGGDGTGGDDPIEFDPLLQPGGGE